MARKLIELDEAAKMIGVSSETLNLMRERHEIYGYRDGSSWKFKAEDVDKLIAERAALPAEGAGGEFAEMDDDLDSILLSEVELGESGPGTSSTVIGKTDAPPSPESDIQIARPRDVTRKPDPAVSDVVLASQSGVLDAPALGAKFDQLDTLDLDLPTPAESGITLAADTLKLPADQVHLGQDIMLGNEDATAIKPASDLDKGGSAIELAAPEDDDDLVLGGSGAGSDVTHAAGDSGISLVDPADSGLSLEEVPLELGGSAVETLELGEEEGAIVLEEEGDSESATQLKTEPFLLTPLDDAGEESDSGSQAIALDSGEVPFEEVGAFGAEGGLLEEDFGGAGLGAQTVAATAGLAPAGATMAPAVAAEAPYSIWNVLLLSFSTLVLVLTGMMMVDLMRNMWSWNGEFRVNSSLMDTILGLF